MSARQHFGQRPPPAQTMAVNAASGSLPKDVPHCNGLPNFGFVYGLGSRGYLRMFAQILLGNGLFTVNSTV
jgi:hypothetical protein